MLGLTLVNKGERAIITESASRARLQRSSEGNDQVAFTIAGSASNRFAFYGTGRRAATAETCEHRDRRASMLSATFSNPASFHVP